MEEKRKNALEVAKEEKKETKAQDEEKSRRIIGTYSLLFCDFMHISIQRASGSASRATSLDVAKT